MIFVIMQRFSCSSNFANHVDKKKQTKGFGMISAFVNSKFCNILLVFYFVMFQCHYVIFLYSCILLAYIPDSISNINYFF